MPPLLPDEYGAVTKTFCCDMWCKLILFLSNYASTTLLHHKVINDIQYVFYFFEEILDQAAMMTSKRHVSFSLTADS